MMIIWRTWLLIVLVITAVTAKCQWKVWHYESKKQEIQSLITKESPSKQDYIFFGLADDYDKNVISGGHEPFSASDTWKVTLNKLKPNFPRHLYFNLYSKNIATLKLQVCENNGKCYERRFDFPKDGYQIPFEWTLEGISATTDKDIPATYSAKIELRDKAKTYQLIVGEAISYQQTIIKAPSKGPFFHELTRNKENQLSQNIIRNFGNSYPLQQKYDLSTNTGATFNFEYNNIDSTERQNATLKLIKYFFQKYPFYKEHSIDQKSTLSTIDTIISSSLTFSDKTKQLDGIADRLYDAHFYFQKVEKNKLKSRISSPLILKRIDSKIQVVGIRDERLESKISLGDQVYMIDGRLCEKTVDSLSNNYFGDPVQRQELAISHLLEKKIDSSLHQITFQKPDGSRYETSLKYDKMFSIPDKFVPKHFGFYRVKDNWAYLKINKWDRGDWIKFYNLKDSLKYNDGIILDLRGNPGGYEIETVKIASCFLDSPVEYSTQTYATNDKQYTGKTIVKPNSFLNLSKLKVIILVDNKTACASESFAFLLKAKRDATIIGTARTSSSFSTVHAFQFPEGILLNANILSKIYLLSNKSTLESKGIIPDLMVKIDNYTDLYGYNDNVLGTALQTINYQTQK